jgi:carboxymethylenebutenolidase
MSSAKVEVDGWASWLHRGSSRVGVVLVHEIFGHDAYIETVAANLAREGFWAAAIDLYRGRHASTLEEGLELRSSLKPEEVASAIEVGSKVLGARLGEGAKVGSMGFCMGGGFALLGACRLPLAFCVDYYGMIENVDEIRNVIGPIQLYVGSDDQRITPWAFQQLLPAAAKFKKRVDLQLYPNAQHAFHRPNWEGHNPEAAKDAWLRTLRFLSEFK